MVVGGGLWHPIEDAIAGPDYRLFVDKISDSNARVGLVFDGAKRPSAQTVRAVAGENISTVHIKPHIFGDGVEHRGINGGQSIVALRKSGFLFQPETEIRGEFWRPLDIVFDILSKVAVGRGRLGGIIR